MEILCKGCPDEFIEYFKYVGNLGFTERPDYASLRALFAGIFKKKNLKKPAALEFNLTKAGVPKAKPAKKKSNASTEKIGIYSGFEGQPKNARDVEYDQFLKDIAKPPEEDSGPSVPKKGTFKKKEPVKMSNGSGSQVNRPKHELDDVYFGNGHNKNSGLGGKKPPSELEKLEMMAYNAQPRMGPTIKKHG